jgi:hypothetical protein
MPVNGTYEEGDEVVFKNVTFYNPAGRMIVNSTLG